MALCLVLSAGQNGEPGMAPITVHNTHSIGQAVCLQPAAGEQLQGDSFDICLKEQLHSCFHRTECI